MPQFLCTAAPTKFFLTPLDSSFLYLLSSPPRLTYTITMLMDFSLPCSPLALLLPTDSRATMEALVVLFFVVIVVIVEIILVVLTIPVGFT